MPAEFCGPPWLLGGSHFGFLSTGEIVCTFRESGEWALGLISQGHFRRIPTRSTDVDVVSCEGQWLAFIGASPLVAAAVQTLDLSTGRVENIRSSRQVHVEPPFLSRAEPLQFDTGEGESAHGFLYDPRNRDYALPTGQRPPLIVMCHGGPTASTSSALRLGIQFWTSRGFAVLDVDYRGSSGYGRDYRRRLRGRWGILDVEDCVAGARSLTVAGRTDPERQVITGSSAGGYTTLCALTFRSWFSAGASYYGISDLEALARDTHKFESRYLDRLVAPYPQGKAVYQARSPLHHAERISCPVIFFQGADDPIVPASQSSLMHETLRDRGVPTTYLCFAGERHGFRRSENLQRALEAEFYFYGKVFGFAPADEIEPLQIDNLG
jgi:dipeptidyl aminopeptidase/acylaminoacyl peptidase